MKTDIITCLKVRTVESQGIAQAQFIPLCRIALRIIYIKFYQSFIISVNGTEVLICMTTLVTVLQFHVFCKKKYFGRHRGDWGRVQD